MAKILQSAYLWAIFSCKKTNITISRGGQDGDHRWWRHGHPTALSPIKHNSSCKSDTVYLSRKSGRYFCPRLPLQGGKTFCASFCASLIAGSRRALCLFVTERVQTEIEWNAQGTNVRSLSSVFFPSFTLDSEQPMLKKKIIIPSVWGGIKSFEHFQRGECFCHCAFY